MLLCWRLHGMDWDCGVQSSWRGFLLLRYFPTVSAGSPNLFLLRECPAAVLQELGSQTKAELFWFSRAGQASILTTENCTHPQHKFIKKSFSFIRLGNSTSLEQCLDSCCGNDLCELAIRSGAHCYGISCDEPELCHRILDQLLWVKSEPTERHPITGAFIACFIMYKGYALMQHNLRF